MRYWALANHKMCITMVADRFSTNLPDFNQTQRKAMLGRSHFVLKAISIRRAIEGLQLGMDKNMTSQSSIPNRRGQAGIRFHRYGISIHDMYIFSDSLPSFIIIFFIVGIHFSEKGLGDLGQPIHWNLFFLDPAARCCIGFGNFNICYWLCLNYSVCLLLLPDFVHVPLLGIYVKWFRLHEFF